MPSGLPVLGLELAIAVVTSSAAPLLLLDGNMQILAASDSFHAVFGLPAEKSIGRPVFSLDGGAWDLPRLRSALAASLTASTPIEAYEFDLTTRALGARRLVLNARLLEYAQDTTPRVLVSIADVTDARLAERVKDELIRERDILIQEVQHRVANSLQIIASVLLQSARKVQSDEVRRHLQDAHNRVMSIASVQDQLAVSGVSDVALRPYLNQLCSSIGASMIEDHDQLALTVRADDVVVSANVSVSLGLIVTELVINALKHAFPGNKPGHIHVDYASGKSDWALVVADDGVGMPVAPKVATSGLGSSIVQALAKQLKATVFVRDNQPGTSISVTHAEPATDGSGPAEMPDTPAV